MTAADAHAIAAWRYPGEYSFYDADADPDDLAESLDPAGWERNFAAAMKTARHELAGVLAVKLTGQVAEIGLGLRPDLTGHGAGEAFVRTCLRFASAALGAQRYILAVAAFNRRAITVYERAGFQEVERFDHVTMAGFMPLSGWPGTRPRIPHDGADLLPHGPAASSRAPSAACECGASRIMRSIFWVTR